MKKKLMTDYWKCYNPSPYSNDNEVALNPSAFEDALTIDWNKDTNATKTCGGGHFG